MLRQCARLLLRLWSILTWRHDAATAKARTPLTSKSSAALDDPVKEVETLLFAV
jgi:hypothetical protein